MRNKKVVLLSALEPWSMQNNVGAPSLYETLKGYSDGGFEVTYITYHKTRERKNLSHKENIDLDLPGLTTLRVDKGSAPSVFNSRLAAKMNRLHYEPLSLYHAVKKYLDESSETPAILYAYEAHGVQAVSKLDKKYKSNSIVVNRFQGTILGNKYKNILHCLRKYEMFRILREKADKYVMTNDGTLGDKALKYWNKDVNDENLLFIRNGFNFESFLKAADRDSVIKSLGLNPDNFYAFTVSRLTLWKRVDRAIDLIYEFHKKYPKLHLIVVGDGEYKEDLINLAKEKNISDRIHFIGGQGREKVAELMASLEVFLSLYDVSNLGNPLFEAMISAQCVITLDNGTTKEVISHNENGIMVAPEDRRALYSEFETILNNEEKRLRLKKASKQWADKNLQSWSDRMKEEIQWVQK